MDLADSISNNTDSIFKPRFKPKERGDEIVIDPKDIIEKYSVEELNQSAEEYFASVEDVEWLLTKPLSGFFETPQLLQHVGMLFSGAKLCKSMTVLDFAAGTCWLSHYLNQLECRTISVDVSPTALEIGKEYFEKYSTIRPPIAEPQFLVFDGYRIDLPDESVDRILCNDGFHHIPNQQDVLNEFYRVLKDGGIVGFSEPGRYHSQTPLAQHEMKNFVVLENDLIMDEIYEKAKKAGFTGITLKIFGDIDFSLREYNFLNHPRVLRLIEKYFPRILGHIINKSTFFLSKGELVHDSRGHLGLSYEMTTAQSEFEVKVGEAVEIPVTVKNTGSAIWLHENFVDIGIVKIGTNLLDENGTILINDFAREVIDKQVKPGETLQQTITLSFDEPGDYHVGIDLLSEQVIWFKVFGSQPAKATIRVS